MKKGGKRDFVGTSLAVLWILKKEKLKRNFSFGVKANKKAEETSARSPKLAVYKVSHSWLSSSTLLIT